MKEISFFSVPDINKIDDYIPFRNVSLYLNERSRNFKDIHRLLPMCGYSRNSHGKFLRHQEEWNSLKRNIPLKYLSAIGAELAEIESALEADRSKYQSVLRLAILPKSEIKPLMPTVYSEYQFDSGTLDDKAVGILKRISMENNLRTCINISGIKSICIEPSGEVNHSYYYPKLMVTKTELVPSYMGEVIGKTFVS